MSDQPDPNLLKKAVDDREAHPWRYYRLDHDVMKRMLDQLAERAERAEAQPAAAPRPASAALQVSRFEVIDDSGRVYVARPCLIELSYQDDGRTLKVFVERPDAS